MLLPPFCCWRFWHSKSDWFSIQCSLSWTMLPYPFPVDTYWGLTILNPMLSFFPTKIKHRLRTGWFWQDCTVLNQQNLLMIIQRGKGVFVIFLFLIPRSWDCCSDYQSVVPDTSFIIIQWGKITAKKFILLIIHMCSKSDGSNLCPFIQYSIFKQIQKLPRHLTVWNILCQIVMASLCQ